MVGRPTTRPIGMDPTTAAGQGRIMETMDPDQTLAPIMITGVALTMETMGVVMVLTMGTGGTMMITGVGLITETMDLTMDLTMGDGVTMMTMRVDPTMVTMTLTMEIMAPTMQDGEIMTVDLPMEIMAQITTAGEVAQTMEHQTIGATMTAPLLTQISFPPPRWKS